MQAGFVPGNVGFARDLVADSKSTSGGMLRIFGDHAFSVPISWAPKKHTAVSQCSTEAEVISLDTGLRIEG